MRSVIKITKLYFNLFISSLYFEITKIIICHSNPSFFLIIKKILSIIFIIAFFGIYNFNYNKDKAFTNELDTIKYDIVIPMSSDEILQIPKLKYFLKKYINFNSIIIIASNKTNISNDNSSIIIINEDQLVPKNDLIKIFLKKGINNTNRVGWYEQQFLKMSYSKICTNEYYLLWDSDTIPIKPLIMFENGYPIFDLKKEHHSPYFTLINLLIPALRFSKLSYISEHMIIKTDFMKNLLNKIESNKNLPGKMFWEKILLSIDNEEILKSGFSEFETYGTYVDNYYTNFYKHRLWSSKRDMSRYYGNVDNLSNNEFTWLSKDYDAITFEKRDKFDPKNLNVFNNNIISEKKCRPSRFFKYFTRIMKKYKFLILKIK